MYTLYILAVAIRVHFRWAFIATAFAELNERAPDRYIQTDKRPSSNAGRIKGLSQLAFFKTQFQIKTFQSYCLRILIYAARSLRSLG